MKTKLRIAFENLVKLKSHQQEMAVLSYTVEMSNRVQNGFVCENVYIFFSAEVFSMNKVKFRREKIS